MMAVSYESCSTYRTPESPLSVYKGGYIGIIKTRFKFPEKRSFVKKQCVDLISRGSEVSKQKIVLSVHTGLHVNASQYEYEYEYESIGVRVNTIRVITNTSYCHA